MFLPPMMHIPASPFEWFLPLSRYVFVFFTLATLSFCLLIILSYLCPKYVMF